jgi:putative transposase
MIVHRLFKYRLYPTKAQQEAFDVQFGHARFVYNFSLETSNRIFELYGERPSHFDLKKAVTVLKYKPEYTWLQGAASQVLQDKLIDLHKAFERFFQKKARRPKFKTKKDKQSIRYSNRFKLDGNLVYLPKIGWVKAIMHRKLAGRAKNVTAMKTKSGEYYIVVCCEYEAEPPVPNLKPTVGVDLGIGSFAVLSSGEKIANPRFLKKSERRLKRLYREVSHKKRGSKNRAKARIKLARACEHVSRQRDDFLHKLSHRLVTSFGMVKLETLGIETMRKNRRLAKSISDSGWGKFARFCEYKAPWAGSATGRISRFFPSSRVCHICGTVNAALRLSDRSWTCCCGAVHDRDLNAAIVIRDAPTAGAAGSLRLGKGRRLPLSGGQAQPLLNQEASTLELG